MRRRRLSAAAACVLLVIVGFAGSASAATVEVLGRGGHVHVVNNPFLAGSALTPGPEVATGPGPARHFMPALAAPTTGSLLATTTGPAPIARMAAAAKPKPKPKPKPPQVTVGSVLYKLELSGAITAAQYDTYLAAWNGALTEEKRLTKARRAQMASETVLLHDIAAAGQMTAPRLPVLFLTLQRNAQWWQQGSMLSYGQRVQFAGSNLVWEYYPGQGIQLQVLGTFSEADGYYEAGKGSYPQLQSLMAEMIPLAVQRAGALTWEYYFNWDGGSPPWVSAMAQATAIEALTNAYKASGSQNYLSLAHQALPLLSAAPPAGVGVRTALGWRFLQYSFAPKLDVINAFLQTLIGIDSYARASGDATAQRLFTAGNAQAESELPAFNTGAWSLYQPGVEDDLSYHQLVIGFAQNLCTATKAPVYCTTAADFEGDLKTPPVLTQLTQTARSGKPFALHFQLSKVSRVGIVITSSGVKAHAKPAVYTSAEYPYGVDAIKVEKLKPGTYAVKLTATDLAGNYASLAGSLIVYKGGTPPPTPPPPTTSTTTTPTTTTTTPTTTETVTTPALPPGSGGAGL